MYRNIMVPLDGSELAECVLPHVEALANSCQVENVTFVRLLEPMSALAMAEAELTDVQTEQIYSSRKAEAENYLGQLVSRLKHDRVNVRSQLIERGAVEALADYAAKNGVDLIIIATHGRSGISRWVWGSVTDRILHSSCVPVLMIRPPGCVPGL